MTGNRIGDYLRARRDQVRPEQVGLRDNGRRRVPGLRRDELAMLAGISTEYYTRLEQGRDQHPSVQVLDAVARALHLDEDARAHLHELAAPTSARPRAPARPEREPCGSPNSTRLSLLARPWLAAAGAFRPLLSIQAMAELSYSS